MKKRIAIILLTAAAQLTTQSGLAQDQSNLQEQSSSQTVSVSELKQEPAHAMRELNQRGVSLQGLFMNDWSEDLNGRQSATGFGRYSLDLTANLDGKKVLGWKGASVSVRMKQHINEFGETYDGAAQVPSNIDAESRTVLYELWAQQTLFSEKLRIKAGKIDANTEFDQVQAAGDFLNSSMGYSPTIMAFPSYPEPKLAAVVAYSLKQNSQVEFGVFRTAEDGLLSIAEPEHAWTLSKSELPGHIRVGYWRLDGDMDRFDGSRASHTQGVYSVLEQSLLRQALKGDGNERQLSAFFQFGHSDGHIADFTAHLGAGVVLQAPFNSRPHDAVGAAITTVQFSPYNSGVPEHKNESILESYYKLTLSSHISLVQDFQFVHRPAGLKSNRDCPILTPRVVIAF